MLSEFCTVPQRPSRFEMIKLNSERTTANALSPALSYSPLLSYIFLVSDRTQGWTPLQQPPPSAPSPPLPPLLPQQ